MFDFEKPREPNTPVNEKKVISAFIKSMMSDMADDPDAPERLRLDVKSTLTCMKIGDYCMTLAKSTTKLTESEEDMKKLRDILEYVTLVKTGMETFFQCIGFSITEGGAK